MIRVYDLVQTFQPLQTFSSTSSSGRPEQSRGGRRFSVALAASASIIPRRNSAGGILMLPHGLPASSTPVPGLSTNRVARLASARSISALKTLRGALQLAQRGGDGAMVRSFFAMAGVPLDATITLFTTLPSG